MNYIKHLASFFDRVSADERLNPTHISMYVSLFQFWNANRFQNPISISRSELMKVSKISSKATYHKCMKELNEWKYLQYKPSYNPFKGSMVYLFNLQAGDEQALIAQRTKIGTSIEQAQEPYININKHIKQNIINGEQIKKRKKENFCDLEKKEKSCVKKEMPTAFEDAKKKYNKQSSKRKQREIQATANSILRRSRYSNHPRIRNGSNLQRAAAIFQISKISCCRSRKVFQLFPKHWLAGRW